MPRPLQFGDPNELGPFRLSSRLHESPAGIVYLGADAQGRQVEVALLTTAAADDPAARDRFRVAVAAQTPTPGQSPRPLPTAASGEPAPVVAALLDGAAPWVATVHTPGCPGAARFLEPVLLKRGWGKRRLRGPQFQPYWLSGPKAPALRAPEPVTPASAVPEDTKGLATAAVSLAALLAVLALLVVLLFACEPTQPETPPPTPTPTQPSQVPPPATVVPRPTPTPGRTSPTPDPSPTGGSAPINPASDRWERR